MTESNNVIENKVKKIVGDSKGDEARKKILHWLDKNRNYSYSCYITGPDGKPKEIRKPVDERNCR